VSGVLARNRLLALRFATSYESSFRATYGSSGSGGMLTMDTWNSGGTNDGVNGGTGASLATGASLDAGGEPQEQELGKAGSFAGAGGKELA